MLKKHLKNQKGLTLIELLAVIVILGIIAAIAVPAIGNVINNSRDNAALADAQQIIEGAKLYVASEGISGGTATITPENLSTYVTKAGTFTSVSYNNGQYSILGHRDANAVLKKDSETGVITETELIEGLD